MERLSTLLRKKQTIATEPSIEEPKPSKSLAVRLSETLLRKKSAPVVTEAPEPVAESAPIVSESTEAVATVPEQASVKTLNEESPAETVAVPADSPAVEHPKQKQDFMTRLLSLPRKRPAPKVEVAADEQESQESKEAVQPEVRVFNSAHD